MKLKETCSLSRRRVEGIAEVRTKFKFSETIFSFERRDWNLVPEVEDSRYL